MKIIGLKAALNANGRYKYKDPEGVVDFLVVGGGVVGLAIARLLSQRYPSKSTYLVERNANAGEETSSRNSEVVHAGLYYPANSLKESLCLRGRHLLYKYCQENSIPFRKTGKLVVAYEHQRSYIESLHKKAKELRWPPCPIQDMEYPDRIAPGTEVLPTKLLTGREARELEPDLSPNIAAALYSPETGIIDSHTYMESLERDITESGNGQLVYSTGVVRVDPSFDCRTSEGGWVVQIATQRNFNEQQSDALLARNLINASGLSGNLILNSLLPKESLIPMYYARGSYAAYNGPGVSHISHLLYPCPDTDKTGHAFQSLGTHLTLDLDGNIKFGPDLQWISAKRSLSRSSLSASEHLPAPAREDGKENAAEHMETFSYEESDVDFWKEHLAPDDSQLEAMYKAVSSYLPGVDAGKFRPDYVGIRPKLVPPWGGFQDFVFRADHSCAFMGRVANNGSSTGDMTKGGSMITLLGIESPGLTASLAIAEKVVHMLYDRSKF